MITKEMTYKKAFEQKTLRLKEKQNMREQMLRAAYISNGRLSEIDSELSKIGAELAITALSGNTARLEQMQKLSLALTSEKTEILKNADVRDIEYECDICKDTGYVGGKICECIKREAAGVMSAELSLKMPLGQSGFGNFDLKYYSDKEAKNGENPRRRMTSILKLCREYAIGFNEKTTKNLLFLGGTGLGKTHLTLAIVKEVIAKGYLPIYASAENLFTSIEAEKFDGEGKGVYQQVLNCDLLVIDDLGAEMTTAFTKSVLYNVVNTRLLSGKPTIINTNLTMKEIEAKYTPRISSRFIGEYDCNKFLGEDIRQQKLLEK
ncbi:MAG: ATP-binding protein [Clostridia bacterium]|nr:ATP-binding protein [Clostridia bacterium]